MSFSYFSFKLANSQAIISKLFIAKSTGITSDDWLPSHNMDRITPLAAPIIRPDGPLKLSTQPGTGSSNDGDTIGFLLIKYCGMG